MAVSTFKIFKSCTGNDLNIQYEPYRYVDFTPVRLLKILRFPTKEVRVVSLRIQGPQYLPSALGLMGANNNNNKCATPKLTRLV